MESLNTDNSNNMIKGYPKSEFERIHHAVGKFFIIEDTETGKDDDIYYMRYRGKFRDVDLEKAFDQISESVSKLNLVPLFREESGQQAIFLVDEIKTKSTYNRTVNLILFIVTLLSVWVTGGLYAFDGELDLLTWDTIRSILLNGWPFAVSMIAILGAHEMGHFIAGRIHNVNVTLPYFIPLPIVSPFGTMGAFINMKGMPKNKKQLFDIGIAGPLSGLVVAIPVLFIGLSLSSVEPLPSQLPQGTGLQLEGNSLLYLFAKYAVFGELLPAPPSYNGGSEFIYWIKYFFTGQPLPLGGSDVLLHQVAWAGWAGLLVTALNLIPVGQLDGGHIINSVFGKSARKIFLPLIILLVALGFVWPGWWIWAALIFFIGRIPAAPYDMISPLDSKRRVLGLITMVIFILVFIPVPIISVF